jgi:hypothetical protein
MNNKAVEAPYCEHCGKVLDNWTGNVMVDASTHLVKEFIIWCKECTRELDRKGYGRRYHNIWELSWVKNGYFELLRDAIDRAGEEEREVGYTFTNNSLKQLVNLGEILYDKKLTVEEDY